MATASGRTDLPTFYVINTALVLNLSSTENKASNSSTITWSVSLVVNQWSSYASGTWLNGSATISGLNWGGSAKPSGSGRSYQINGDSSGSGSAVVASGTIVQPHQSNGVGGTYRLSLNVDINCPSIASMGAKNVSATIKLGDIVKAAPSPSKPPSTYTPPSTPTPPSTSYVHKVTVGTLSTNTLSVGKSYVLTLTNSSTYASTYKHDIQLYVNNKIVVLKENHVGVGNVTITIPTDIGITTSQVSASIFVQTNHGTSYLGSDFSQVTIDNSATLNPTITNSGHTVVEDNAKIKTLALGTHFISGESNFKITINTSAIKVPSGQTANKYYAKIMQGSAQLSYMQGESTTINLTNVITHSGSPVTISIYVGVITSVGTSAEVKIGDRTLHPYSAVSVSGTVTRNSTTQTTVDFRIIPNYKQISIGGVVKNNGNVIISSSETQNGSYAVSDTPIRFSSNNVINHSLKNVSLAKPRFYKVTITDNITTTAVLFGSVGTEAVPLDIFKTGIGVGTLFNESKKSNLQVGSGGIESAGEIFGPIGAAIQISKEGLQQNTDLNNLVKTGVYYSNLDAHVTTFTNCPTTSAFMITVFTTYNSDFTYQEITTYTNKKYFRRLYGYNKAWTPWVTLI
ncbi:TPA: pyocin knob domain-containing protein [Streptococcus suis]